MRSNTRKFPLRFKRIAPGPKRRAVAHVTTSSAYDILEPFQNKTIPKTEYNAKKAQCSHF